MAHSADDLAAFAEKCLDACVVSALRRASRNVATAYDVRLEEFGVKSNQLTILLTIAKQGEASVTRLADDMDLSVSSLSRSLAVLAERSLINMSSGSGRTQMAALTDEGTALIFAAAPAWERAQNAVTAQVPDISNATLLSILKNMARAAGE